MCQIHKLPSAATAVHSHSDLTRQMEELESHALALRQAQLTREVDPEHYDLVLEDLRTFTASFTEELIQHMVEEEQVIFPMYDHLLTPTAREILPEVLRQHKEIRDHLKLFDQTLNAIGVAPSPPSRLFESLHTRAKILRYTLTLHTALEQEYFQEVADAAQDRLRSRVER
jgi:iron-sulfur cluster repair protein YtfE (RIC family)